MRVRLFLVVVLIAAAGCDASDQKARGVAADPKAESARAAVDEIPPAVESVARPQPEPRFQLSPEEKTRLLFPALLQPTDPAGERCVRTGRGAAPPAWFVAASRQPSCTSEARAALLALPANAQDLLTTAALCDDVPAIARAIAGGADPNRRDSCGCTALVAAAGGHPDSVRALLAAGARTNLESRQGTWSRPPLLAALIARDADSARLLLDARANANVQTTGGRSALMLAASIADVELTRALLRRRADPCHHDGFGLSPIAVARVHGNEALLELLGKAANKCQAVNEAGE